MIFRSINIAKYLGPMLPPSSGKWQQIYPNTEIMHSHTYIQKHKQIYRMKDEETERQRNRHRDVKTDRQISRKTETQNIETGGQRDGKQIYREVEIDR